MQSVVKRISRGLRLQSQSVALKNKKPFPSKPQEQCGETSPCEIILRGVALFVLCSLFKTAVLLTKESKSNEEFISSKFSVLVAQLVNRCACSKRSWV